VDDEGGNGALHRDDQGKQKPQEKRIKLRAKRARQAAKK
jgi:hypothetical protein